MKITPKYLNNPWIVYFPFLLFFILLVIKFYTAKLDGDEGRYLMYAQNLLHGYYSPKDEINLWNGPGYPIFIAAFLAIKLPGMAIALANSFLRYLSIVFLFKTIQGYTQNIKIAHIYATFWALYYIAYQELPLILTETFASFLVVMILFFLQRNFNGNKKWEFGLLAGLFLGFLVLTKVVFGYALIVSCLVFVSMKILFRWTSNVRSVEPQKIGLVYLIAFVTIMPYLMYTFSLTNRFPYFANSGGMSLYWMSTPFENEYGDWNNELFNANCGLGQPCNADKLKINHQSDINFVNQFRGIEKDDAYKRIAINNIKTHPLKYLRNCFSNVSRLLFGFPSSYFYQRDITFIRIIPNAALLVCLALALVIWLYNFKNTPVEINVMALLVFTYLMLSCLLSAYPRQFYIIVPMLLVFISNAFNNRVYLFIRSPQLIDPDDQKQEHVANP